MEEGLFGHFVEPRLPATFSTGTSCAICVHRCRRCFHFYGVLHFDWVDVWQSVLGREEEDPSSEPGVVETQSTSFNVEVGSEAGLLRILVDTGNSAPRSDVHVGPGLTRVRELWTRPYPFPAFISVVGFLLVFRYEVHTAFVTPQLQVP